MFKPIFMDVLRYMSLGERQHYTVIHFDGRVVRAIRGKEVPKIEDQERVYMYPGWSKKIEKVVLRNLKTGVPAEYVKKYCITITRPNKLDPEDIIILCISAPLILRYNYLKLRKLMGMIKKQKEEKA